MKVTREIKTAGLVLISLFLIVFMYNYLKGENILSSSTVYYTVYDNVEGLGTSSPVTINGFVVGKVQELAFAEGGSGQVKVTLLLEEPFDFSVNSEAQLYENGLIGGKAIAIIPAFDDAGVAQSGATLKGTVKDGLSELLNQRLTPLQEKIESMMVSTESLVQNLNSVFDTKTKENLRQSFAELNTTIVSFRETSDALNQLLEDNSDAITSSVSNVNALTENLASISDSLATADLNGTITDLRQTVQNFDAILTAIDEGEGSIGKLLQDDALYDNLSGASEQLEALLQDLKLNPKRYVHFSIFGKKAKIYDAEGNEVKDKD